MTIRSRTILVTLSAFFYSAHAAADCGVSAEGLSFGQYDMFVNEPTESVGTIIVTCSPLTSYTLLLSPGNGSYTERELAGEHSPLVYNLYVDPAYSQVWGDGSGVSTVVSGSIDGDSHHDVYGRIPARQNVTPGLYSDTVIVTIEF